MKIGKFVGKETKKLSEKEVNSCDNFIKNLGFDFTENSEYSGRVYKKPINNLKIVGSHNYWGTQYNSKEFKGTIKSLQCCIMNQSGLIETDKIFEYVEGSEINQYSISLKTYGDFRYKYQRGISENVEVYSYYDYDTDLKQLLNRLENYYINLIN